MKFYTITKNYYFGFGLAFNTRSKELVIAGPYFILTIRFFKLRPII